MDVNEIRQRLEHELSRTGSRLHEQGWPLDPRQPNEALPTEEPQGDTFDRIGATESREACLLSRERLTEQLDRILEALQRLRDGSYGTCAECGDPIAARRLRAIPEATRCVRCQERMEPGQASRRTVRAFYTEPAARVDEPDDD
jgi:RNA polymerase-binding protein DksA